MKLGQILATISVLATIGIGYSMYAKNTEDRRKVAEAPVISSVLPPNARTLWGICSVETKTENERYLCVERFKELNPGIDLGRLQRNVFYQFPDLDYNGVIGQRKD